MRLKTLFRSKRKRHELDKVSQVYRPTESSERGSEDSVVVFDANDPLRQNPLQRPLNQYDELTDWSTAL